MVNNGLTITCCHVIYKVKQIVTDLSFYDPEKEIIHWGMKTTSYDRVPVDTQ